MNEKTLIAILSEFQSLIRHVQTLGCTCPVGKRHCDRECMGQVYSKSAEKLLSKAKKELAKSAKR